MNLQLMRADEEPDPSAAFARWHMRPFLGSQREQEKVSVSGGCRVGWVLCARRSCTCTRPRSVQRALSQFVTEVRSGTRALLVLEVSIGGVKIGFVMEPCRADAGVIRVGCDLESKVPSRLPTYIGLNQSVPILLAHGAM